MSISIANMIILGCKVKFKSFDCIEYKILTFIVKNRLTFNIAPFHMTIFESLEEKLRMKLEENPKKKLDFHSHIYCLIEKCTV